MAGVGEVLLQIFSRAAKVLPEKVSTEHPRQEDQHLPKSQVEGAWRTQGAEGHKCDSAQE